MGPAPTIVSGEDATVGDVAIVCAAATLDEPVAVVDNRGKLRRVLRREDLLLPARARRSPQARGDGRNAAPRFGAENDPR